jgi:hypothetical protein
MTLGWIHIQFVAVEGAVIITKMYPKQHYLIAAASKNAAAKALLAT